MTPTPAAQEPVQSWDDETIITRYRVAFGNSPDVPHLALMRWMRDDMQAQIASLTAQLAEAREWEDVTEGEYATPDGAMWQALPDGQWQIIDVVNDWVDVDMPDGWRIQHKREERG